MSVCIFCIVCVFLGDNPMSLSQIRIKIQLKNSLVILTITQLRDPALLGACIISTMLITMRVQ